MKNTNKTSVCHHHYLYIFCLTALLACSCNDEGSSEEGDAVTDNDSCTVPSDCLNRTDGRTQCDSVSHKCVTPASNPIFNCGNSLLDDGEECDGFNLNGKTCEDMGNFIGGNLMCFNCKYNTVSCVECSSTNTSKCAPGQICVNGKCTISDHNIQCGDGLVEGDEECDGENLNNKNCADMVGLVTGMLACNTDCTFNTKSCAECSYFNTTLCKPEQYCLNGKCSDIESSAQCGNEIVEGNEECDKENLNGKTCADVGMFAAGTLACNQSCEFDTSACDECTDENLDNCKQNQVCTNGHCTAPGHTIECGDSIVEGNEECDKENLNGKTCADVSTNKAGTLKCTDSCIYDDSECLECTSNAHCAGRNDNKIECRLNVCSEPEQQQTEYKWGTDYTCGIENNKENADFSAVVGEVKTVYGLIYIKDCTVKKWCDNVVDARLYYRKAPKASTKSLRDLHDFSGWKVVKAKRNPDFKFGSGVENFNEYMADIVMNSTGEYEFVFGFDLKKNPADINETPVTVYGDTNMNQESLDNTGKFSISENHCGDSKLDPSEECDYANEWASPIFCRDVFGKQKNYGGVKCNKSCKFDYSDCKECRSEDTGFGEEKSACKTNQLCLHGHCVDAGHVTTCGDGLIEDSEQCDGSNLNDKTCADVVPNSVGTLKCTTSCAFDTSGCVECMSDVHCGDFQACENNRCIAAHEDTEATCYDGYDNDGDGKFDFFAPGCASFYPAVTCGNNQTYIEAFNVCAHNIASASDLISLRDAWNQTGSSTYVTHPERKAAFVLTNDIDLGQQENWTGIGTNNKPFDAIFFGNNHKLSGTLNKTTGLFNVVEYAIIDSVNFELTVDMTSKDGENASGILAATGNDILVTNSTFTTQMTIIPQAEADEDLSILRSNPKYYGGILGGGNGSFRHLSIKNDITIKENSRNFGGVIGVVRNGNFFIEDVDIDNKITSIANSSHSFEDPFDYPAYNRDVTSSFGGIFNTSDISARHIKANDIDISYSAYSCKDCTQYSGLISALGHIDNARKGEYEKIRASFDNFTSEPSIFSMLFFRSLEYWGSSNHDVTINNYKAVNKTGYSTVNYEKFGGTLINTVLPEGGTLRFWSESTIYGGCISNLSSYNSVLDYSDAYKVDKHDVHYNSYLRNLSANRSDVDVPLSSIWMYDSIHTYDCDDMSENICRFSIYDDGDTIRCEGCPLQTNSPRFVSDEDTVNKLNANLAGSKYLPKGKYAPWILDENGKVTLNLEASEDKWITIK